MLEPGADPISRVTLPNVLSVSRIVIIPPLAAAILYEAASVSVALFCLAVATDFLDGFIARRSQQASRFGALLDHAADATFVSIISAVCAFLGLLPALLPVLIAFAFVQYSLDSRGGDRAGLRASRLGRLNGIAYFIVTGIAIVAHLSMADESIVFLVRAAGWVLIATTLASIAERAIFSIKARRA